MCVHAQVSSPKCRRPPCASSYGQTVQWRLLTSIIKLSQRDRLGRVHMHPDTDFNLPSAHTAPDRLPSKSVVAFTASDDPSVEPASNQCRNFPLARSSFRTSLRRPNLDPRGPGVLYLAVSKTVRLQVAGMSMFGRGDAAVEPATLRPSDPRKRDDALYYNKCTISAQ